jgi:co-chaperonin GroES (HSP10)
MKEIKALGNYVVLKFIEEKETEMKKSKGGLILPNGLPNSNDTNINGQKHRGYFVIHSIGNLVKEELGLKVGMEVEPNRLDLQPKTIDEEIYAITKSESISALITEVKK